MLPVPNFTPWWGVAHMEFHILPKDVTAQLGLVTCHTMEHGRQDGHPIHVLTGLMIA